MLKEGKRGRIPGRKVARIFVKVRVNFDQYQSTIYSCELYFCETGCGYIEAVWVASDGSYLIWKLRFKRVAFKAALDFRQIPTNTRTYSEVVSYKTEQTTY